MKKIISMLLVVTLMACLLAGCGGDKLEGTWKADLDLTDAINAELAADPTLADYFTMDDFGVTMIMDLKADGTFTVTLDEASVQTAVENLTAAVTDGTLAMLEAELEGTGMTVEDALAMTGMTMDEFMEQLMAEMDVDSMVSEMCGEVDMSGEWEAEDGMLLMTEDGEVSYESYEFSGDTLTFTGEGVDSDLAELNVYPIVFTK